MPFTTHRARMLAHFLWLDAQDCAYAAAALKAYRTDPSCPCPDILKVIKAEQARQAQLLTSSPNSPST